jgi:hypothetical protein
MKFGSAPHFTLAELMLVDCREARVLLKPVSRITCPCAILLLARFLEDFRREVDTPVFISATAGTARRRIKLAARKAFMRGARRQISTGSATLFFPMQSPLESMARSRHHLVRLFLFDFGHEKGQTSDHLHIDLGFVSLTPRECSEAS